MKDKQIYLDYSATTPCDKKVLKAMMPYFSNVFGNPGSTTHRFGWEASDAVSKARGHIAKAICAEPKQIIFTSGATEANNIAIKGCMKYLRQNEDKNHVITLVTEHKCVLQSCADLEEEGFEVTYLPVNKDGLVDLDELSAAIRPDTGLVSIAWVHNEIGVIQNIPQISSICESKDILLHSDCAQALGKIEIDVGKVKIDLLSLSGHKIYGPKGIGALYVRRGVRLNHIISGGGQERGLRSGTIPVPLCVGMGEAARISEELRVSENIKMRDFQNYMHNSIMSSLEDVHLNGSLTNRVPHNLNFSFGGVEGESIMMYMEDIAVSSGSACTSSSLEPSYVISALGLEHELVHSAIRIGFGRNTTKKEVVYSTQKLIKAVKTLRTISPLWAMKQNGVDLHSINWIGH